MYWSMYPVDVISVCSTEGEIRPLRLRLQREGEEMVMDITDVLYFAEFVDFGRKKGYNTDIIEEKRNRYVHRYIL